MSKPNLNSKLNSVKLSNGPRVTEKVPSLKVVMWAMGARRAAQVRLPWSDSCLVIIRPLKKHYSIVELRGRLRSPLGSVISEPRIAPWQPWPEWALGPALGGLWIVSSSVLRGYGMTDGLP